MSSRVCFSRRGRSRCELFLELRRDGVEVAVDHGSEGLLRHRLGHLRAQREGRDARGYVLLARRPLGELVEVDSRADVVDDGAHAPDVEVARARVVRAGCLEDAYVVEAYCGTLGLLVGLRLSHSDEEERADGGGLEREAEGAAPWVLPLDSVIVPAPYWPSYPEMVSLTGATPIIMETKEEDGYLITPDALRKVLSENDNVKLLILCNPSNPTGGVHTEQRLRELAAVLDEYPNVAILADEIYERYADDAAELMKGRMAETQKKLGETLSKLEKRMDRVPDDGLTPFAKEEIDVGRTRLNDVKKALERGDLADALSMARQAEHSIEMLEAELQGALDEDWSPRTRDAKRAVEKLHEGSQRAASKINMALKRAEQGKGGKDEAAVLQKELADAPGVIEASTQYLEGILLQEEKDHT